jgi:DNA polymerase-3 subunit epsilon
VLSARHAWARELASNLKLERPLVGLDLETTGPYPEKDRIVQIGYVRIAVDGVVEERELDVHPEREIPAEVIAVHGITNERVANAPRFKDLAADLALVLLDADICGYNVKFDARFLHEEFKRANVDWLSAWERDRMKAGLPGKRLVDAYKIFAHKSPRDLAAAVKTYLNEDLQNAHTALADARAATRVLAAQLAQYPDLPRSVGELHDLFFETAPAGYVDVDKKLSLREGRIVVNFGKAHHGKFIEETPASYLEWMISSDFNRQVKRACREELERRRKR